MNASLQTRNGQTPLVHFWGVRGSLAQPGRDYLHYGGNTACMEIATDPDEAAPVLLVDAGTGIGAFGRSRPWHAGQRIDVLLTHLHLDHIVGLPFFDALQIVDLELHFWCGNLAGKSAEEAFSRAFSPPLFPFYLNDCPARVIHHGFCAGETIEVAGRFVRTLALEHPAGSTAYRIDAGKGGLAILTDLETGDACAPEALVEFCAGADTLIYDMMIDDRDVARFRGWGHSTAGAGIALARAAGNRQLVGFHHGPFDDDAVLARREVELAERFPGGILAREGMAIHCFPENFGLL